MAPIIELIFKAQLGCGEGPHWIEEEKALVFVDIPGPCVFRYDEATGNTAKGTIRKIWTPVLLISRLMDYRPNC